MKIRDTIWKLAREKRGEIKVIIGGGGSTGVELAGELMAWCGELEEEFKKCALRVQIIEAAPTILPDFEEKVIGLAEKRLRSLGVEIIAGRGIARAESKKIFLENGAEIPFDILVWAGGIKAPAILSTLPLELEQRGRAVVAQGMECLPQTPTLKLYGKIYGLGDSVCFYNPLTKKPLPAVARAALAEADVVAHNIVEEIKQLEAENYKLKIKNYRPQEYPYVIPIGGKWAIAKIGPLVISGFFAWIFKGLVELNYLASIMPFSRALRIWLKGLKIFIQNDRLG